MNWIQRKLDYLRCETIYLLGGIPKTHINTIHYRNVGPIFENIRRKIDAANKL